VYVCARAHVYNTKYYKIQKIISRFTQYLYLYARERVSVIGTRVAAVESSVSCGQLDIYFLLAFF